MNKETFINLIENAQNYSRELDRWYDFGIELEALPISDMGWKFFNLAIQELFTEEGVDWINWWLFEKVDFLGKTNEAYNSDGSLIPTNTIDDLWELVKNHQK